MIDFNDNLINFSDIKNKYYSIESYETELRQRFTEEKYNLLPKDDLNKLRPLSEEYSNKLWSYLISDKTHHYALIENKVTSNTEIVYEDCGWGDKVTESITKNFLKRSLNIDDKSLITFFWNRRYAMETEWGVFLKYWTDFCYPSDDSNIIILHNNPKAIIYVEDKIWIVDRKIHFGRN